MMLGRQNCCNDAANKISNDKNNGCHQRNRDPQNRKDQNPATAEINRQRNLEIQGLLGLPVDKSAFFALGDPNYKRDNKRQKTARDQPA